MKTIDSEEVRRKIVNHLKANYPRVSDLSRGYTAVALADDICGESEMAPVAIMVKPEGPATLAVCPSDNEECVCALHIQDEHTDVTLHLIDEDVTGLIDQLLEHRGRR